MLLLVVKAVPLPKLPLWKGKSLRYIEYSEMQNLQPVVAESQIYFTTSISRKITEFQKELGLPLKGNGCHRHDGLGRAMRVHHCIFTQYLLIKWWFLHKLAGETLTKLKRNVIIGKK